MLRYIFTPLGLIDLCVVNMFIHGIVCFKEAKCQFLPLKLHLLIN